MCDLCKCMSCVCCHTFLHCSDESTLEITCEMGEIMKDDCEHYEELEGRRYY